MGFDIRLVNVRKTFFTKNHAVKALDGIIFDVAPHEFVSVIGPSGCGKSTLLRIISGLIPPSAGEVFAHGKRVDGPNPDVGIVFQNPVLLPWRTVLRNIELQVEVRHFPRADYRKKALGLLKMVGLEGFEDNYPNQLSGGMQQRVSLCRALVHDPALLLMDEPFGALDALNREQMNLELQRVWLETQKTVLFITHSIQEAVFLSDRVVVSSPRPGKIKEIISVFLPRPRTLECMKMPEFFQALDQARKVMESFGYGG
ncbi:MAG: ABC transporter ATP-binding protein [Desulfobacteria bacterium]